LRRACGAIALRVRCDCVAIALRLRCDCATIALRLRCDCVAIAPRSFRNNTVMVLRLHSALLPKATPISRFVDVPHRTY
jgi:hypothetical protein